MIVENLYLGDSRMSGRVGEWSFHDQMPHFCEKRIVQIELKSKRLNAGTAWTHV